MCGGDWGIDLCGECVAPDDDSCVPPTVRLDIVNVNVNAGTLDIYMVNEEEVGGFQFELYGITITGASGGIAGELGFTMQTSATSALAFSLSGATMPVSSGAVLVTIAFTDYQGGTICFGTENSCDVASPNVVSNAAGGCIDVGWGGCYEGGLARSSSNSDVTLEIQNVDVGAGMLDVVLSNANPIGGFQFELFGIEVTGASGGVAGDLGFTMQTSPTSALGFSLSGALIPAASGAVLVQVSFTNYEGGDILFGTENSCSVASPNVISDASGGCVDANWISYAMGCMDEEACNFNADATVEDGSCEYAEDDYDCDGVCLPAVSYIHLTLPTKA